MLDIVTSQWQIMALVLLSGALSGFIAGLLGVGGGTITVPVFLSLLIYMGYEADMGMRIAVATSLALIIPTGLSSARAHYKRGSVRTDVLRLLAPAVACGAIIGTYFSNLAHGSVLMFIFAGFAAVIAASMLFGKKGFALLRSLIPAWKAQSVAALIGGLSALLGIGGGVLIVPTLSACGYSMAQAVGVSSTLGLFVAVPAVIGYIITGWGHSGLPAFSLGYVHFMAFLLMAPAATFCAPYGVRLAHHLPEVWLKRAFACYLFLIAARMVYKALA